MYPSDMSFSRWFAAGVWDVYSECEFGEGCPLTSIGPHVGGNGQWSEPRPEVVPRPDWVCGTPNRPFPLI